MKPSAKNLSEVQAAKYPYNCVGLLRCKNKSNDLGTGTGFLIDTDLVLTSAFYVYDKKQNYFNTQLIFYPGVSGKQVNPFEIIEVRFCPQYKVCKNNDKMQYEYALLKLDRPIHYQKYLPLSVTPKLQVLQIGLFGYQTTNQLTYQSGYWEKSSFSVDDCQLYHELQTRPGNGGSPILSKKGSSFIVLAIHSSALRQKKQQKYTKTSRLITADLIQNVIKWSKQMNIDKKYEPSNKYEEIIAEKDKQLKMLRKANQQYKIQIKYKDEKIQQLNSQFSVISNIKGTANFVDQSFQHSQFMNYKDEMSMDPSLLLCHKCQSKEDEDDELEDKLKMKFKQRIQTLQKEKKQLNEVIDDKESENLVLNEQNTKLKKKLKKYEN